MADILDEFQSNFGGTHRKYEDEEDDLQNYSTAKKSMYDKTLGSSYFLPIINGAASRFPSTAFLTPYFMQVQQPVAQLDMDWYIRHCK